MGWRDFAECAADDVHPDLFFPSSEADARLALNVCARCRVVDECLDWAMTHNEDEGVWGGLTEGQRKGLRRRNASRYM